jgi:hypothetical protein
VSKLPGESGVPSRFKLWRSALLHALPVAALILTLFYYWFAVADRYIVFLYNHDMGPLYPDTSPFSRVTSSRYWMAGLVASGAVMVLYTTASWLLGRLFANYRLPEWWRVWTVCAVVFLVGVPAITMTVNEPTLPVGNTAQVTLATLIGAGLALRPSELAAKRPGELLWLTADGFGLALMMLNLIHIEKVRRWLARGGIWWIRMMVVSLVVGVVWLFVVTGLGLWRRRRIPKARAMLVAGVCIAYLLMPLVHHLVGTDEYYYISDSDNFFAQNMVVQLVAWLISGGLALGMTWLRERTEARCNRFQARTR